MANFKAIYFDKAPTFRQKLRFKIPYARFSGTEKENNLKLEKIGSLLYFDLNFSSQKISYKESICWCK